MAVIVPNKVRGVQILHIIGNLNIIFLYVKTNFTYLCCYMQNLNKKFCRIKKVKPFPMQVCIISVKVLKRPYETFQKGRKK